MYKFFTRQFLSVFVLASVFGIHSFAQNSILVNLGSANCSTPTTPAFSLFENPLSANPSVLALCNLTNQLPDYFNVFVAYNPKDNNIYICDTRYGYSKVWVMDMGLPDSISCPDSIPVTPTYTYNYLPNNFEFDNNGNLWSFRDYNDTTGICTMDQFDVTTGTVLFTQTLQFPLGNLPNTLSSGDLSILPNGRMFAVFGNNPSQLYEITNYMSGSGIATATYLQTMPQNTYGMAYLNGLLEITGTDEVSSCYYYTYNISNQTLIPIAQVFQNGQSPIDNTSVTPAIGSTKQLISVTQLNTTTADLTYEVYVRNMGNVILNNINAIDDLGAVYGEGNVSNVSVSFESGGNDAGLTLNSDYNGTTDINLLAPGQSLPNQILNNTNYFFKLLISCRVSNMFTDKTYYNSAIGTGNVGSGTNTINVSDSSNNGPPSVVDPNNDGNASEPGENIPTPFHYTSMVPVTFTNVSAALLNTTTSIIKWSVATPTVNANTFNVEYSSDGKNWSTLGQINITNTNQGNYEYKQANIPAGNIYYRIEEIDVNGYNTLSRIVSLNGNNGGGYSIFPNPADNYIQVTAPYNITGSSSLELFDAIGRKLIDNTMTSSTAELNTSGLPNGTYLLRIKNNENIITQKVLIAH